MIELPRPRRGDAQEVRSQVMLELCLNLYALIGALLVARFLLLALGVGSRVWVGRAVYRFTDPLLMPFKLLPGAATPMIGAATLADLTLVAVVVLVPLGLLARTGKRDGRLRL